MHYQIDNSGNWMVASEIKAFLKLMDVDGNYLEDINNIERGATPIATQHLLGNWTLLPFVVSLTYNPNYTNQRYYQLDFHRLVKKFLPEKTWKKNWLQQRALLKG